MLELLMAGTLIGGLVMMTARRFERRQWDETTALSPILHRASRPASNLLVEVNDLPCPWCGANTREEDESCPSCGQRFG